MNKAVHESCHGYSKMDYGFNTSSYSYRVDEDTDATVTWTHGYNIFTSQVAERIPSSFRYVRFDTYIGGMDVRYNAANQYGVYGLLDEFNAYGWGLHNNLCMYNYLVDVKGKKYAKNWLAAGNELDAYAEFKYWFYRYMLHVKDNYPDAFAMIGNNQSFISAYNQVLTRFNRDIKKYKKLTGDTYPDYYKKVEKELKKAKYKEVDAVLKGSGVDSSKYQWTDPVPWTFIADLSPTDEGVEMFWKEIDVAGYKLYRKVGNNAATLLTDTTENTYTDTDFPYDKNVKYYVVPYLADGTQGKKSLTRSIYIISPPKITSVTMKNGKINVKWTWPSKCDYYEVTFTIRDGYYNDWGLFIGNSHIESNYVYDNKKSFSWKPSDKNATYYVTVRVCKTIDGVEQYSTYSEEVEIRP